MPIADVRGINLYYDSFGELEDPALLLIAGLGAQAIFWDDELCLGFVDRGFRVIRYDHRDVGFSTWVDAPPVDIGAALAAYEASETLHAPYQLADLADDATALIDHLGIHVAHLVGISLGGMVAQQVAIDHPDRVASLTSMMSSTGEPHVGQPSPEVVGLLVSPAPTEREAYLDQGVEAAGKTASEAYWDPVNVRNHLAAEYDRAVNPEATLRQLLAVVTSGSRAEGLSRLSIPTLVIHGEQDRVIDPSGGIRTAELVPDAELELVADLGHDLPQPFWPRLIEWVTRLAVRAGDR